MTLIQSYAKPVKSCARADGSEEMPEFCRPLICARMVRYISWFVNSSLALRSHLVWAEIRSLWDIKQRDIHRSHYLTYHRW